MKKIFQNDYSLFTTFYMRVEWQKLVNRKKSVSVNRDYFDTSRLEYYNIYTFSSAITLSEWILIFLSFKSIAYLYGLNNHNII